MMPAFSTTGGVALHDQAEEDSQSRANSDTHRKALEGDSKRDAHCHTQENADGEPPLPLSIAHDRSIAGGVARKKEPHRHYDGAFIRLIASAGNLHKVVAELRRYGAMHFAHRIVKDDAIELRHHLPLPEFAQVST